MFSPSATKQNKTHLHEFCVDKACNFPLSISREILIVVIFGTELVFTLLLCQCLPFEALVYIGHRIFQPQLHISKPTRLQPDHWARK